MRAADRPRPTKGASQKSARSAPAPVQAGPRVREDTHHSVAPPEPAQPRAVRSRARAFSRVPTHVVTAESDRRLYPRASLRLPLRLKRVAGQREVVPLTLLTRNISSSGVFFLCPRWIEPGTPVELEVALVDRPIGRGSVHMATVAHIVRVESTDTRGWHGLAASFDDITFRRDDPLPQRFQQP